MDKGFYVALENRFRGSEELVKERQKKYLKFINPLKDIKDHVSALDIGCGRGEWLSLLNENGFLARGIDIDDDMVELCLKKGFNTKKNDALSELKSLEDNSVDIISAFQVVEHIDFDDVLDICKEAMRVLTPCGILILETPNPENIMVSTHWFYLDITHKKPIPCDLLAFATEYCGFKRNFIIRLNEKELNLSGYDMDLFDVFEKVSPDYSIVSQKDGSNIGIFDPAFSEGYGINLDQISHMYSHILRMHNKNMNERIDQNILSLKEEIEGIKNSRSWRITKPLREAVGLARDIKAQFKAYLDKGMSIIKKINLSSIFSSNQSNVLTKKELEIYKKLRKKD
ncbi:class I SAM-dependent methyltransferase [Campylobacter sp. RM16189]|uniref:class I SAM-dependent methyltransferase n=1 Tax=Campylobacter sp. RM16189 TaxID=1705726 RepID=UPI001475850C|nr:class I SAM-dependent methyltransferase [Campylobacter sp. RM16189]